MKLPRNVSPGTSVLLVTALIATGGCGFLFSKGPPLGHEKMDHFYCNESDVGPILDIVWGGLNVLGVLAVASDPGAYQSPDAAIVIGLSWGALSGSAAAVGLGKSKQCRAALLQLALRQRQDPPRTRPTGDAAIASVVVASPKDTIPVGERVQLVATAHHSSGVSVPTTFTWSSSNDAIAAVSNAGLVTAHAPGRVVIAANASSVVGTTTLIVVSRAP